MADRTIVVAGGASGIGLAVAQQAVTDGWRVIIVDRQELIEPVPQARFVRCDLSDIAAAQEALSGIVDDEQRIDALVISAGGSLGGRLESRSMVEWNDYFANDTLVVLRTVSMLLPRIKETAKQQGVADIVVMGSIAGNTAFPDAAVYGSIAAARNTLGEQLRTELRGDQVRARTIATGYVETPLTKHVGITAVTESMAQQPLQPVDVAAIVHHGLQVPPDVVVHDVVVVPTSQGWA